MPKLAPRNFLSLWQTYRALFVTACVLAFFVFAPNLAVSKVRTGNEGGGGGGTINASPIGIGLFLDILPNTRRDLFFFFQAQIARERSPHAPFGSLLTRLATTNPGIMTLIETVSIQWGRCLDKDGNRVDGSIISSAPNSICLDRDLETKLTGDLARAQIMALAAHEYSHLLGFDERDATDLQHWTLELVKNETSESVKRMLDGVYYAAGLTRGAILNFRARSPNENWNPRCYTATTVQDYIQRMSTVLQLKDYQYFSSADDLRFKSFRLKARALVQGACAQSDYDPLRSYYKSTIDIVFKSRSSVTAQEFQAYYGDAEVDDSIIIRRVVTTADFDNELDDVYAFANLTFAQASRFSNDRFWRSRLLEDIYLF